MKNNLPITNKELDWSDSLHIVSTTDLKGAVTYANEDFCQVSGFSEDELLHKNHNIVRHPDMPPAAFQDLWDTIKLGKPWMGIVKNRCKNGDHYWVNAFVTPIFENGKVTGYQSVRLKPKRSLVERATSLYQAILSKPSFVDRIKSLFNLSLFVKVFLTSFLTGCLAIYLITIASDTPVNSWWVGLIATLIGSVALAKLVASPWQAAANESKNIFDNAVARQVFAGRQDELGQLQTVIQMQSSQQNTIIWRIKDATGSIESIAESAANATQQTRADMESQKAQVEQVATAMSEMVTTIQDVAKSAVSTAESVRDTEMQVSEGKTVVGNTIRNINQLAEEVENSMQVIETLEQVSTQIGGVVDVIKSIAEQTNLLALNAAIEAARAGEQGRGFAVVADEVRTLAGRTQSSTEEIQTMIENLTNTSASAAKAMRAGQDSAKLSVEEAAKAGEALDAITSAVNSVLQMSEQIATASEQQSSVSDEINQRVLSINQVSDKTLEQTIETDRANQKLRKEIEKLHNMTGQFSHKTS